MPGERKHRRLHRDGLVLCRKASASADYLGDWGPYALLVALEAEWSATLVALLEAERPRWFEGADEGFRPGAFSAERVNAALAADLRGRVVVTATHPSVDDATGDWAGPRFYASVVDAALLDAPFAAEPPLKLSRLLWWDAAREGSRVTELGFTLVPPRSPPQEWHADIVTEFGDGAGEREANRGRYHHVFVKAAGNCGTRVVRGRFGGEFYAPPAWQAPEDGGETLAAAPLIVIDAEVLHRGGPTGERWSSTRTVQFASAEGWRLLHEDGRCSAADLGRTLPLRGGEPATPFAIAASAGACALPSGFAASWDACRFVEAAYAAHGGAVRAAVADALARCPSRGHRLGVEAAAAATDALGVEGLAVYAGPSSISQTPPFDLSAPRFYVSVTAAARKHYAGAAPPPPEDVALALLGAKDGRGAAIRGAGWTLVPPRSDPQQLHSDLWVRGERSTTSFPHLLWKVDGGDVGTQYAPGRFAKGRPANADYANLESPRAPVALVDAEVLHRGGATGDAWSETMSLELATRAGADLWRTWRTEGSTRPEIGAPDEACWALLDIAPRA